MIVQKCFLSHLPAWGLSCTDIQGSATSAQTTNTSQSFPVKKPRTKTYQTQALLLGHAPLPYVPLPYVPHCEDRTLVIPWKKRRKRLLSASPTEAFMCWNQPLTTGCKETAMPTARQLPSRIARWPFRISQVLQFVLLAMQHWTYASHAALSPTVLDNHSTFVAQSSAASRYLMVCMLRSERWLWQCLSLGLLTGWSSSQWWEYALAKSQNKRRLLYSMLSKAHNLILIFFLATPL